MSAAMTILRTPCTADEFLALGETEERMELIEGEIVVMNTPRVRHQAIVWYLVSEFELWMRAGTDRGCANIEVDHRLDDRNVFAPDLWWVRSERRPARDATHVVGVPDLAIEVRSDSTWRYDIGTKKRVYERHGLQELWLVDTAAESILVYRRSSLDVEEFDVELEVMRGETLTSPQLPDFTLDIAALFDR